MRIPYQYAYSAFYMLKGGGKTVARTLHGDDVIDIPEVRGGEAPVAAEWRNAGEQHKTHVRIFEGKFFQPASNPQKLYLEDYVRTLTPVRQKGKTPSEREIAHSLSTSEQLAAHYMKSKLERLLVVDGIIYQRCRVPALVMKTIGGSAWLKVKTSFGEGTLSVGPQEEQREPLMSFDLMTERMEEFQGQRFIHVSDLEVHLPEELDFNPAIYAIATTVGQALNDTYRDLYMFPKELAYEFKSIQEDFQNFENGDDVDVASLLERTYTIFTSGNYYLSNNSAAFFDNYDRCQALLADMDIDLRMDSRTKKP